MSIKGGVGKSTTTAGLALALRNKMYRVGLMDIDLSGANLPSALGIPEPWPALELDLERDKMSALSVNGYWIFSLAFRYGKSALLWEGGEQIIQAFGEKHHLRGTGRYNLIKLMLKNVTFPELDYKLFDLPPQSGDEVLSLFENLPEIWGAILVCQPTGLATQDIERTLNMVEVKKVPLLGMVGNMTYCIAPRSGEEFYPYLDAGIDLEAFCHQHGIPYLESIPFTPDRSIVDRKFEALAEEVLKAEPVKIWQKDFKQRLEETLTTSLVKSYFIKLGKESNELGSAE